VASKINGVDGNRTAAIGAGRAVQRSQDAASGKAKSAAERSQTVHITGAASQLAALEQALRDMPAVDEARVAEIRLAISEGRYTIAPERVASQLMQLEQALGQLPGDSPVEG
jgi:negative regulator of flagellin synthesis FlgM